MKTVMMARPAALAIMLAAIFPIPGQSAVQQSFPTPEAAVTAFVKAVDNDDKTALSAILGPGSEKLLDSGDRVVDAHGRQQFLQDYNAKHSLTSEGESRKTLVIGSDDWPLPIPLVHTAGGWQFSSKEGAQQILDRRIGRDEIGAIRTALAYVDAQEDYFDRTKRGLGIGFYAQRLLSTPGHYDGLYWPVPAGAHPSPLGPLVQQAQDEGYPGGLVAGKPTPYEGYFYRVLKAQGANAPGGAKNYIVDGKMTGGFGLIAWPARYGASGVTTFLVNQDGVVYQKDLGPDTDKLAAAITRFDPDVSWARVSVTDQ